MTWRKLHSLSGVVPVGAFLLFHVWITLSIVSSRDTYDRQLAFLHGGPLLGLLEVVLVLVPLLYHAGYGVLRVLRPRETEHGYPSTLMQTLQRASGVALLVFVVAHVWEFRGSTWASGLAVSSYSSTLVAHLSSTQAGIPFVAFGYLLGIAASFFHLANGLGSFCTTWGYTTTPLAQQRARLLFRVGGGLFFLVSALMVVQIATGARFFPAEMPKSSATECGSGAALPPPPAPASAAPLPAPPH